MRKYISILLKFTRKISISLIILSVINLVITKLTGAALADVFQYTGLACIIIGLFSAMGKMSMSSNITYLQSKSVSNESISDWSKEEFESRDGNLKFLVYMVITGGLLIIIGMTILPRLG